MKKIKNFLSKILESLKKLFKSFPVTLITIIIVTLILAITLEQDFIDNQVVEKLCMFGLIFSVEAFFTEVYFSKRWLKFTAYALSAVISFAFTYIIMSGNCGNIEELVPKILEGYLIILIALTLYTIIKKEKLEFREYILKVFSNILNSSIVYIFLNIGITLLSVIFVELILDGEYGEILLRTQILLLGLFYIPAILNGVTNVKSKEISLFVKGLIKYVLLSLVSAGILIIYVYIVKILVLKQIPSNIIFRVLAGIFIAAFPVWNMAKNFNSESKIIDKITRVLPYLYMPFIILEVYSLVVRINEFGITPIRYFGIIFIIFQILAFALTFIKKEKKLPDLFIGIAFLIFISFITPLNFERVSLISQKNILIKYINESSTFEALEDDQKQKAAGAFRYLDYNNGRKYIPDNISDNDLTSLREYYHMEATSKYDSISFYNRDESIDIREYSRLTEVEYQGIQNKEMENLLNEAFKKNEINYEEALEYIEENRLVKMDEFRNLYITELYVGYSTENNEITKICIGGYLLEK